MNKIISCALIVCSFGLTGCVTLFDPIETPTSFYVGCNSYSQSTEPIEINSTEGLALYRKADIIVKAKPQEQDYYHIYRWTTSPCNMFDEAFRSYYLGQIDSVTDGIPTVIQIYIDKFDQTKIDGKWYADFRVKYSLVKNGDILAAKVFNRQIELKSCDVKEYVFAQNKIFNQFLAEVNKHIKVKNNK